MKQKFEITRVRLASLLWECKWVWRQKTLTRTEVVDHRVYTVLVDNTLKTWK